MNSKELAKWLGAILLAFLITLVVGLTSGFPENPDAFRARAESLHKAAMAGENLGEELVLESSPKLDEHDSETRYGFIGDVISVMKWYPILFSVLYFFALLLLRVRTKETVLGSLVAALVFFYLFGLTSSALLAVAVIGYVCMNAILARDKSTKIS